jgi:hypothetical protein
MEDGNFLFFSLAGINKIPPFTNTNAKIVPILVKSKIKDLSVNKIGKPTATPVMMVAKLGVLYFG